MDIRKAEKKDITAIAQLVKKVMEPYYKNVGDTFMPLEQYQKALTNAFDVRENIIVAEDKGKLIAIAHYFYEDNQVFITDIAVDPKHQRKEVGKSMMNIILTNAKKLNMDKITMLLHHGNEAGSKFLKKFGFKEKAAEFSLDIKK